MKVKGKINNIVMSFEGYPILTLDIYDKNAILREYDTLKDVELLDIEIKKYRNKRSLNANNYLWSLINEMANVLNSSKDEVYLQMLKRYGQSELVSILAAVKINGYFKYYEVAGETILNGKNFIHYRVFKGSSEYDTKEMSILIDGVVSECKELGIETMTPLELESLKNSWRVGKDNEINTTR